MPRKNDEGVRPKIDGRTPARDERASTGYVVMDARCIGAGQLEAPAGCDEALHQLDEAHFKYVDGRIDGVS